MTILNEFPSKELIIKLAGMARKNWKQAIISLQEMAEF